MAHDLPPQPVLKTHKGALERFKEEEKVVSSPSRNAPQPSGGGPIAQEDVGARCETVLNTTMAEFEVYHAAKRNDFENLTKTHLDSEIAFYEKVINESK